MKKIYVSAILVTVLTIGGFTMANQPTKTIQQVTQSANTSSVAPSIVAVPVEEIPTDVSAGQPATAIDTASSPDSSGSLTSLPPPVPSQTVPTASPAPVNTSVVPVSLGQPRQTDEISNTTSTNSTIDLVPITY